MRASSSRISQMAIFGLAVGMLSMASTAKAQLVPLFDTQNDWSAGNGWSGQNGSSAATVPPTVFDGDLSLINGGGNFASPGGAGTPGALQVIFGGNGFAAVAEISGENGNNAFISAFDPGASGNTAVPYSGQVTLLYTQPVLPVSGGYFQIGLFLQYSGDGYYGPFLSSSQVPVSIGVNNTGEQEYEATIPYSIVGNVFNGFGLGIFANTNAQGGQDFYVDSMTAALPEPASLGLIGAGASLLTMRRRRRA